MRAESSNAASSTEGPSKSESKSEKHSDRAKKSSDEASKAAEEARKASDEARKAADEANRATTKEARQGATRRAEQAATKASELSKKAETAAKQAEQAARDAAQSARPGTADTSAVQAATQAATAARAAARASAQSASAATKTVNSLRTPGTADQFSASSTASTTSTTSTAGTTKIPNLPPPAQAAVDQARQAQTTAQSAAAASTRADQRVQQAQAELLRAQQAATLARNDLDRGPRGYDPAGNQGRALSQANNTAMENLAAARLELSTAQAEASSAATQARTAAGTADQAAQKVEQFARQQPEASVALNAVAADTRRAGALARSGATLAAEAAKPQPSATVSFDLRFERENMGGQHDIIFDGAVVGAGGKVYPPGSDAGQIPGVLPNNGRPATGERIYYVNGIQNTAAFQSRSIQNIANTTGAEVVGIHNSTESMFLDLQQCALDKLPTFKSTNAATRALANQIVKDIEAGRPIHLMAHSQGGLVTSGALTLAKEYLETIKPANKAQADAILKNIKVETFGSAASSWPHGPQYTHYINENDTVPMLTGLGRQADPARQVNAGGDRAEIHFIRDDPRTPNPALWSPETNAVAGIPAHDFNDGYLSHRQSWEAGQANSVDLSGPSPVAVRDPKTNELQGYNYYVLDTSAPEMQEARERRDGVEQFWQSISGAGSAVATGVSDASDAVLTGLNDASDAVLTGLNDASDALLTGLNDASEAAFTGLNDASEELFTGLNQAGELVDSGLDQAGQAVTSGLDQAGQAVRNGASTVGNFLNPANW